MSDAGERTAQPNPRRTTATGSDQDLDYLSHLLDDFITIPGTPIRIGLDGIVGFVPGIGDLLAGLASTIIIVISWRRGVPKIVVARMVANVAIEMLVGIVPIVGNLFDIAWRANRRNYKLLEAATREPTRKSISSWFFVFGVALALMVLMVVPFVLAGYLLEWVKHGLVS